ncbi:uncharacterized protein [Coffea arabica]|uniref:TFIIS central domain-containing protein n=1 Tax=Coffea arabica TaxID=13443 RepID=A0ABM4VAX3_COFAR|nr:uncharacterized protein LOC113703648 [Coffea arabica]
MSNQLVSQQFQFPDGQMVHMDHLPEKADSLTGDMQKNFVGHVSSSPMPLHFTVTSEQMGTAELMPKSSAFQNVMVSTNQIGQIEPKGRILGFGASEGMLNNLGSQTAFLPSKRKAEMEAKTNVGPQNVGMPNKRTMQIGISPNSPQLLQPLSPNKKSMQMQSKVGPSVKQTLPASNKKMVRNDSTSNRTASHRVQTPKSRTVQNESSSKVQTESFGAVRSKMREQLAAALFLASQNPEKTPNTANNHADVSVNHETATDSQSNGSELVASGAPQQKHEGSHESFALGESALLGKFDDAHGIPTKLPTSESTGHPTLLPDDDVSFSDNFFVKDELLQGNGLSWALDLDMQVIEEKEKPCTDKTKDLHAEGGATASEQVKSPEKLASEIEAELFKLFGGVNKKYKEKGRSLLFNLKDRNNPDLRERVMSGEITPDRLCSMTAEELASKELSEWRMAKAEELAQMVVLPDTDLRRRLVKTHKGEHQVEMEDDGISVDVSGGSSSPSQAPSKSTETRSPELDDTNDKEKTASQKNASENQDPSSSFIIPSDGSDLMQGMMVDELKDVEFLPPIISLDEFMESLNSEPPFENLQVGAGRSTPRSDKDHTETDNEVGGSDSTSKDHGDTPDKADDAVRKDAAVESEKRKESPVAQNITHPATNASTVEHTWEGALQLSTSSSVKTFGVFVSGEKTSVTEWPSSLEVKGRVRLDAFEKFIKDLPNSRSRAVMVMHFVLKDNLAESERANLSEAIESYVSDDRLGFAEPANGAELYLCPTKGRVVDMLSHYLSKDRTDIFNSSDNGLIGVIVWRKVQLSSTLSPNSSSHQKHTSLKRQHFTSRRQQEKDSNVNVNMMNKATPTSSHNRPPSHGVIPPPSDDDDSDIPPGFGPPAGGRDDDDLPEFNFSGNVNPRPSSSQNLHQGARMAARPVDQIRELIHKYGQTEASASASAGASNNRWLGNRVSDVGLGIEPWNDDDDDDDDMPEWRPQAPYQQRQPRQPGHGFHQPLQPTYGSQTGLPTPHLQQQQQQQLNPAMVPSQAPATWHQGAHRWVEPPVNPGNVPGGDQYYRMPGVRSGQRQDSTRSRGY